MELIAIVTISNKDHAILKRVRKQVRKGELKSIEGQKKYQSKKKYQK